MVNRLATKGLASEKFCSETELMIFGESIRLCQKAVHSIKLSRLELVIERQRNEGNEKKIHHITS